MIAYCHALRYGALSCRSSRSHHDPAMIPVVRMFVPTHRRKSLRTLQGATLSISESAAQNGTGGGFWVVDDIVVDRGRKWKEWLRSVTCVQAARVTSPLDARGAWQACVDFVVF